MYDYILNGAAHGDVADRLLACDMDPNVLRPYLNEKGQCFMTINKNGKPLAVPVHNVNTTLRKDEWQLLDDAIIKVAKPRLKAVADVRGMGLTFNVPNGMGTTVLQTENVSDINPAIISMDALRDDVTDRPEYGIINLPLPIIHKDFSFSARQIETSRRLGSPIDTTTAELAGVKVAEEAEKLLLGVSTVGDQYAYGGGTIYGYTDFPNRLTKTITSPTASGWTGTTFVNEILAMKLQSFNAFHYGPFMLYTSVAWDQYLDNDFKTNSDKTLRNRVKEIDGITGIRTLDFLTGEFDILLVQMTSDVVREVIGMEMTTVQWESKGGLQKNFKVMAIMVPQLRADQNGNTGIVHGTV